MLLKLLKKPGDSGGLIGGDEGIRTLDLLSASCFRTPTTTGFQQLRVARRGETRKITALSAPYTHPE